MLRLKFYREKYEKTEVLAYSFNWRLKNLLRGLLRMSVWPQPSRVKRNTHNWLRVICLVFLNHKKLQKSRDKSREINEDDWFGVFFYLFVHDRFDTNNTPEPASPSTQMSTPLCENSTLQKIIKKNCCNFFLNFSIPIWKIEERVKCIGESEISLSFVFIFLNFPFPLITRVNFGSNTSIKVEHKTFRLPPWMPHQKLPQLCVFHVVTHHSIT